MAERDAAPHRIHLILSLAIIALGLGCRVEENPLLDSLLKHAFIPAKLDTQFQLKVDQTALIRSENMRIAFLDVAGDSRCPSDVVCIWAGEVSILVNIWKNHQNHGDLILTRGAGKGDQAAKTFDGYSIELVKVEPYPVSIQKIELPDYIITLVVAKIQSS